jgi:5-formyltetrahydrofolate cyclo-ligase
MEKTILRKTALARRRALSKERVAQWSARIQRNLRELPQFQQADIIFCYVSSKDNEADTFSIMETLLDQGRTLAVPVMQKGRQLAWSRLKSLADLHPAPFGILEPLPEKQDFLSPTAASLCLCPGIAFNDKAHRIGYGGGYFDRFLKDYPGKAVGLAYDMQRIDFSVEPHDIPLFALVTESSIYYPTST